MKALIAGAAVSAVVAAGVVLGWEANRVSPPAPPAVPAPAAAPDEALARRVAALEARLEEMAAANDRLRKEAEEALEAERKTVASLQAEVVKQKEKASAAESLMAGYAGEARSGAEKKPEDMDAFAKEVSKGMRKGIREEFRKISDLITNPTPEGLDARRRQLKFAAAAFGANAGLDQAETATLERVLNETDEKAREELRPILQGVEDYKQVDYVKVKKVTEDSFSAQDVQFDKEFPKEKSERLKRQLEPIRNIFGAMIDELGKQSTAEKDPPK